MTIIQFLCTKCSAQNEIEKEVSAAQTVTISCPFCKTVFRVNGSAVALPEGEAFEIDQRYII